MTEDDSLVKRLIAAAETIRQTGRFSLVETSQLLLQAARGIQVLEGKLAGEHPASFEGSSRAMLRT